MPRISRLLTLGLVAFTLLVGTTFTVAPSALAATISATTTCSNGVDDTPGLGLICEVTVDNVITPTGGTATVTVRECHGAAGDPEALCFTTTTVLTEPVTSVTQCNDATNGGGGTLRCSVDVVNTFVGFSASTTAATVNQCVGSGDGFTVGCDPFPATTSGATITQCNGSANGGTLVGLDCTATGTEVALHLVTINQCNGSTNGGGGLVICSTSMSNNFLAPAPTATAAPAVTAAPTATAAPAVTAAPTATAAPAVTAAPTATAAPAATTFAAPTFVSPGALFPGLPSTSTAEPVAPSADRGAVLLLVSLTLGLVLMAARRVVPTTAKPRR